VTDSKPSKSARKREQHELQQLGEQLIALNDAELASIPLDEPLLDAVRAAKSIKSRGALRRQRQYIGKLMRDVDPEPIRAQLVRLRADEAGDKKAFALAETWRNRITSDRAAGLAAFEAETGIRDEALRALLRELDAAFGDKAEKSVRRKIFRRVHEILGKIPR